MSDSLKVNAKTKILTFKKKHNLLVEEKDSLAEDLSLLENDLEDLANNTPRIIDYDDQISAIDMDFFNEVRKGDFIYDEDGSLFYVCDKDEEYLTIRGFPFGSYSNQYEFYVNDEDELELDTHSSIDLDSTTLYNHVITVTTSNITKTYEFISPDKTKKTALSGFVNDFKRFGGTYTYKTTTTNIKCYKLINWYYVSSEVKVDYIDEEHNVQTLSLGTSIPLTNYNVRKINY